MADEREHWPPHDEIVATSMLLGEGPPILCSCCLGKRTTSGVFGSWRRCGQCRGLGYDLLGSRTRKALGITDDNYF
jgi:hypothetical protein